MPFHGSNYGSQVASNYGSINNTFNNYAGTGESPAQACLRSLSFKGMTDRLNDVDPAMSGTCGWLLEHHTFNSWASATARSFLWIKGKPGSGKSTLMKFALKNSHRIPNLIGSEHTVFSFFFNGRGSEDQKSPLGFWKALLQHFLQVAPGPLAGLVEAYEQKTAQQGKHGADWDWHVEELRSSFEQALPSILGSTSVLMYIDALDECGEKNAKGLIKQLKAFLDTTDVPDSRRFLICMSCRPCPILSYGELLEIDPAMENWEDITVYVRNELPRLGDLHQLIAYRARGVFMWARLVVEQLQDMDDQGEAMDAIRAAIDVIPPELNELYQRLLPRMTPESLKLIQWLCFSMSPLSLGQLQWAMAIDPAGAGAYYDTQDRRKPIVFIADDRIERKLKNMSCGLIETASDRVQFIHQSVHDFFIQQGLSSLIEGTPQANEAAKISHLLLAETCLSFLIINDRPDANLQVQGGRPPIPGLGFSFELYAKFFLISHAQLSDGIDVSAEDKNTSIPSVSDLPLFACSRGFLGLLKIVMRQPGSDSQFGWGQDEMLLRNAIDDGHAQIVEWLLASDRVRTDDESISKALHRAASRNQPKIAELLLLTGKGDVNWKNPRGETPFHVAAGRGHLDVVNLFIHTGEANIDLARGDGSTALHLATKHGRHVVVNALLIAGADVDLIHPSWGTPLLRAVEANDGRMVNILLLTGKANANWAGTDGRTALHAAAELGHLEIVRTLLYVGKADVNSQPSRNEDTPLSLALQNGHQSVAMLLSQHRQWPLSSAEYIM